MKAVCQNLRGTCLNYKRPQKLSLCQRPVFGKRFDLKSSLGKALSSEQSSADQWSLYDNPILYEAAFDRDFPSEVQFLEDINSELTQTRAASFLDVGCGPGNHSVQLALRGHKVFALDLHPVLLSYAKSKADAEGVDIKFLNEDMTDFTLPEGEQVDVALIMFNTMLHLHCNRDAQDCFQSIFEALKPGGLLIVELPRVQEIFDGSFIQGQVWEDPIKGHEGVNLITEYGTDDDEFDFETQVLRKRIGMSLQRGDDITLLGEQYIWHRFYTYQELSLLADLTGFDLIATFGDLNMNVPMDSPEGQGLVACLQKPETESDADFVASL